MSGVCEIKRKDFSFWYIGRIVRGYQRAKGKIFEKNIGRDYTFSVYDHEEKFCGYSSIEILMPVSPASITRIAPFILSLEDNRFYQHKGIDWRAIGRAVVRNIQNRRIVQGGSTLSMQLVRNTLIETSRSPLRKTVEIFLARNLEKKFSKDEILRLYCEQVYMGKGLRGLQSAAFFIYRKSLSQLSNVELCGILGLLRAPRKFSPYQSVLPYYRRQNFVSGMLMQQGKCCVKINPIRASLPSYSRICRTAQLETRAMNGVNTMPVKKIGVTINSSLKKGVDELLARESKDNETFLSIAVIENQTGEMLVESSWKQGNEAEFSPALDGRIQPGSTFKVFALIAAIEQGYNLDCPLQSTPFYSKQIKTANGFSWNVRNYGGVYRGEISLLRAFVVSDNCAFANLAEMLNHDQLFSVYQRFGLIEDEVAYPSIVLGATRNGINPVRLALAYQAIARNGILRKKCKLVRYTEGFDHQLAWSGCEHPWDTSIAMDIETISPTQSALRAAAHSYGMPHLWGKTGTTNAGRIFAGYTKKFTVVLSEIRATINPMPHERGIDKTVPFFRRLINKLEP